MPEPRLLFLHAMAPPFPGGTPIIVHRLLSRLDVDLDTVTALTLRGRPGPRLPGRYHYFLPFPHYLDGRRAGRAIDAAGDMTLAVLAGVQAAAVARRRRSRWVLSVADRGFSLVAGDVAARLAGVPHVIWVFDLWEENAYPEVDRWIAGRLERGIWRRAAAILGHDAEIAGEPPPPPRAAGGPREVLFGGALYWAQEDALRRLSRVCRAMPDVRLTVIGDERSARALGVEADVFEAVLPPDEFRARVQAADVAFLGLSFDSPYPDVIATASPARLPECMASATPILVHAPAGSHVAEYARRGDFAEVVDRPDDAALAAGLRRVLDDRDASTMRARRARELALERHDVVKVAALLRVMLDDTRP
ncbi:MAG TPA: hypothetical protein VFG79_03310 [Solirubrobacter sp.]|nr:hypothetical protein [Solirubrobacter sp.]